MRLLIAAMLLIATTQVQALALGPDEFVAAKRLSCVLAQDSLGYLNEDDFAALTDDVLEPYDAADGDVIYAKALGYFDGLMFGIPEQDAAGIQSRLRSFVDSQACTQVVGFSFTL